MLSWLWYNSVSQEVYKITTKLSTQKSNPRRAATLRGFILCLLALAPTVKPLANIVANYACCDSQKEIYKIGQVTHLLSVARVRRAAP
jgi:hypothetical protein